MPTTEALHLVVEYYFFYLYSFAKLELIHMDQLEDKRRSQGERKISGFHVQSTLCIVETSVIGLAAAVLTLQRDTAVSCHLKCK